MISVAGYVGSAKKIFKGFVTTNSKIFSSKSVQLASGVHRIAIAKRHARLHIRLTAQISL